MSSSSGDDDEENGGRREFEGPSSSRQRFVNGVWPEPFVEALASQVAIDASLSFGRLAAAPALANLFQVCSTWRAVSRSDLLWNNLTRRIWNRSHLLHDTWHDEFIYRHRTTSNFRFRRSAHTTLHFDPSDVVDGGGGDDDNNDGFICRCLALSDFHLACGFADGAVRLFDLATHHHTVTYRPQLRDRLGRFSAAVSGIIMDNVRLVFATLDGDIHVAIINNNNNINNEPQPRRAHLGDVVNDGALVDFTGCNRWWVGLYAGVPGRGIHIWDSESEQLMFVGGSLTDPEAVLGWHLLTELTQFVGRVRVTSGDSAVACTGVRVMVFDLRNQGVIIHEEESRRGLVVGSFDANESAYVTVDNRGVGSVRRVDSLEQVCRFAAAGGGGGGGVTLRHTLGCMNSGYALMCAGGVITVWEVEQGGEYLYRFRERIGEPNAFIADDRHVAACCSDATIHLWDFGAQ